VESETGNLSFHLLFFASIPANHFPVFATKIPKQPATERGYPERVQLGKIPSALSRYVAKKSAVLSWNAKYHTLRMERSFARRGVELPPPSPQMAGGEGENMKWDRCLWGTEKMWHCLIREDCSTCPYYKKVKENE